MRILTTHHPHAPARIVSHFEESGYSYDVLHFNLLGNLIDRLRVDIYQHFKAGEMLRISLIEENKTFPIDIFLNRDECTRLGEILTNRAEKLPPTFFVRDKNRKKHLEHAIRILQDELDKL